MGLYELLYVSLAVQPMLTDDLVDLLDEARSFNAAHGITGLLVYHRQEFMQLLEGEQEEVEALYARIALDPRHQQVHTLWEGPVAQRSLEHWTMGFLAPDEAGLGKHPGYTHLLAEGLFSLGAHPTRGRRMMISLRDDFLAAG